MNKCDFTARLVADPEVRYGGANNDMAIARFRGAVDRNVSRQQQNADQPTADFLNFVAFGKTAEFAEKYLHKGTKIALTGRIQTGSYTNREGVRVYTTDVIVEEQEFAESKAANQANVAPVPEAPVPQAPNPADALGDGFMNIPEGIDEALPFS